MTILFLTPFLLITPLHLYSGLPQEKPTLRKVTKALLLPLLLLYYVAAAKPVSWCIVAALVSCTVGDLLLLWPDQRPLFTAGMSAFGAGHVFYTIYLLSRVTAAPSVWILILLVLVYAAGIYLALHNLIAWIPKPLHIPCGIYCGVISLMSLSAFLFALSCGGAGWTVFLGSLLFLLSDTILSFATFRRDYLLSHFLIMLTYAGAQACIVCGVVALGGM